MEIFQVQECPDLSLHLNRLINLNNSMNMLILKEQPIIAIHTDILRKRIIRKQVNKLDHLKRVPFPFLEQLAQELDHIDFLMIFVLLAKELVSVCFPSKTGLGSGCAC